MLILFFVEKRFTICLFDIYRIVSTGFHTLVPDEDKDDDLVGRTTSLTEAVKRTNHGGELNPRISVSPVLLIEMLSCLYFVM